MPVTSIDLNNSFKSFSSFWILNWVLINCKTACLNRFSCTNLAICWIAFIWINFDIFWFLFLSKFSITLNHLCCKHCSALSLSFGFFLNINLIKSFASEVISSHSSPPKIGFWFCIAWNISTLLLPLNGGYPHNRINRITPHDHTSHFSSYLSFKTSGAI